LAEFKGHENNGGAVSPDGYTRRDQETTSSSLRLVSFLLRS